MTNANILSYSLHARGLRLTPQRQLVLEILREAEEHLDAEGIWMCAQDKDAEINLATIYRALNILVEIGLVQNSYLGEGQKRAFYEIMSKPEHLHFACLHCGKVLELNGEIFHQVQRELEHRHAIKIQTVHLKLEGLCTDCAEPSANERLNQEVR
jgi:Fur family transcriptional regulator, ferric uptake regulator